MTSCVELTDAWTLPGDVKNVTGYLSPVDGCSVGYFQQQADDLGCGFFGWGTRKQCIDAEYALKRFCEEAARLKDWEWNKDTTDPILLGQWCQAVQRSAVPDAYKDKGYPLAKQLLEDAPQPTDWPTELIEFQGPWAINPKTKEWIKSAPNQELRTDADGWLFLPQEVKVDTWSWPEAWDEPDPNSWDYEERHPTRYTWRADVEAWARYLVNNYNVSCNTYYDHPEGFWRTEDSIDVWGPGGRDDDIDQDVGDEIFQLVFNDPGLPNIEWIIYKRRIYHAGNNWQGQPFGDGTKFTNHDDHIHITYDR